ncbi:MAG: nucleotidyltransferase domain-containing protein [Promethearchaeota archaeon]
MTIIKGIEGDYLETKNNNLFFDVKGLFHPKDRKICFVRFYPDINGDRIRKGKRYKKIYNLNQRYSFLKKNFPQYLFYSEELNLEVQGVKNEEILRIYTPREYLNGLFEKKNLSRLEKYSKSLCELFISKGDIPKDSIGISGSSMIGLSNKNSDIDVIIYGTNTSLQFQEKLFHLLKEGKYCRGFNLQEYRSHYKWRVGGSNIAFNDFLKSEKRKLHQGIYNGFEFFIRYIKSPEDWKGNYYDYKFKNLGRIKLKAEVIDSSEAIFTPCTYKIKPNKIIDSNFKTKEIRLEEIKEVNSFRGRFCEQCIKGERVFIEGKIEKVVFKNSFKYFRILLSDQVQDKMLII